MTALAQQHRAGKLSEWRGSTVGRLLEDDRGLARGLSCKALYEAGDRFSKAYAGWQAALASRRPMACVDGGTPTPEDVERSVQAVNAYERANRVLQQLGQAIRQATHTVCCDHHEESWTPPFHMAFHTIEGLKALAAHYGLECQGADKRAA